MGLTVTPAGGTATAETLGGTTIKSTVTGSSLTSVGTLVGLAVNNGSTPIAVQGAIAAGSTLAGTQALLGGPGLSANGLVRLLGGTSGQLDLTVNAAVGGSYVVTLVPGANVQLTLPVITDTIPGVGTANTFTAAQLINNSLGGLTSITGGANNLTITSGTGNSRTLILRTTTSGGTATTFMTGNADQTATFASNILFPDGAGMVSSVNSGYWIKLRPNTPGDIACVAGAAYWTLTASGGQFALSNGLLVPGASMLTGLVSVGVPAGHVGGTIFTDFTSTSTTHTDGTEDDLFTHTTVANTFGANGDSVEQVEHVSFVSSATAARRLKKYFGGTLIFDSGSLTLSLGGEFSIYTMVIRESATVVRCDVSVTSTSASTVPYSTYTRITGLTLSSTNILKTIGIASGTGAASADISNILSRMAWNPA